MRNINTKSMEQRRKAAKKELIFGIRPVIEAILAGKEIEQIFIQQKLQGELFRELKKLLEDNKHIPQSYVPKPKLDRLTTKLHQGVVALIPLINYQKLEDILPTLYEEGKIPLVLILDRITDVRNFGAIVRTAECTGVHAIVVPSKGAAQIGSDAMKTSAGALSSLPICREFNLKNTIRFLQQSGLQVICLTEKAETDLFQANFCVPTALIMGSEEDGISAEYLKLANGLCKIPILSSSINSYNVSVAAGLALYEVLRQRATTAI